MMIVGRLITGKLVLTQISLKWDDFHFTIINNSVGLCGGVVTMTSPIYITEISSDAVRGTLGSSFMVMIVLGTITT